MKVFVLLQDAMQREDINKVQTAWIRPGLQELREHIPLMVFSFGAIPSDWRMSVSPACKGAIWVFLRSWQIAVQHVGFVRIGSGFDKGLTTSGTVKRRVLPTAALFKGGCILDIAELNTESKMGSLYSSRKRRTRTRWCPLYVSCPNNCAPSTHSRPL